MSQKDLKDKHKCVLCDKEGTEMVYFLGSWNYKRHMADGWLKRYYGVEE